MATRALVLLSGGIDSSACVDFCLQQNYEVRGLFADFGQLAAKKEDMASKKIASHYSIDLKRISLSKAEVKSGGFIPGRNAFLIFTALIEMHAEVGQIVIGIHSGTRYWDCSQQFVGSIQTLLDGYTGGRIQLLAPFQNWTKAGIWEYCRQYQVPVQATYSCELGMDQPCGHCESCKDLEILNART